MTLRLHKTGIEFPDGSWQYSAQSSPVFKNLLINGDMSVNQRNFSEQNVNVYSLDRWYVWGNLSGTSQGTTNGTKYFLRQSRASETWSGITQTVETKNMIHAIGHRLTLSFKLRVGSAFDGSIGINVRDRTDAEGQVITGTSTSLMGSGGYEINASNTSSEWQTYTMICDVPVSANAKAVGMTLQHTSSVLDVNNYYDITDVQLEISDGNDATDFEHLPYDVQLQRCERYYQPLYVNYGTIALCHNGTQACFTMPLRTAMRTTPSFIADTYDLSWAKWDGADKPTTSLSALINDNTTISFNVNGSEYSNGESIFYVSLSKKIGAVSSEL